MAYDEGLLQRVREAADTSVEWVEKKMFGGVAIMLNGNMACGIIEDELMVRVGPQVYEEALRQPYAREMDFTGRPLKGLVMVGVAGIDADEELAGWVARGVDFAGSLPVK
ncbi:MAG: RNA methyltransferase [Candidatus Latescibacteria bacterium]|nr:RNA methyltransferase [Candidatus Latescibacterota bacterium]